MTDKTRPTIDEKRPLPGLEERLRLAEAVAAEAAALAFDYFERRDSLLVETKRDMHDVVSIADRNVEALIRKRVKDTFADDGFLGEEFGLEAGSSPFTWVVDPIDGTNPFVNGMPNWCVSIGMIEGGAPALGVIVAPCLRETYVAAGRLVGYYEPVMHAWDCMAAYALVTEAGGWHQPFPTGPETIGRGALVIAAAPGARADLMRLAGLTVAGDDA